MNVDAVVIGGGALGLSTALHLALSGSSVVLVERHAVGSQASGRAAGLFKSVQVDDSRTELARRSILRACTFSEWAGVDLEIVRSGSVLVARTAAHQELLHRECDMSRGWGVPLTDLTPAELAGRVSYYSPSGGERAVWCPEDIYIEEPMSLIRAYLGACLRHGVEVLEHEAVASVLIEADRVLGVQTSERRIDARVVVDAAGGWARQIAEAAGSWIATAAVRHQLAVGAESTGVERADPITRVLDAAVYLRPARGGLMIGGFESDPLPVDPSRQHKGFTTDDVPLDLSVLARMAASVEAEVPLATVSVASDPADHRGGLFTMSPDGRFILGPAPDLSGLWIATGCNGSGFSSSLAIGEQLAAWIVGDRPAIDLTSFSPSRFDRIPDHALVQRGTWQYSHYYDPAAG